MLFSLQCDSYISQLQVSAVLFRQVKFHANIEVVIAGIFRGGGGGGGGR